MVPKSGSRNVAHIDGNGWRIATEAAKAIALITDTVMNYLSLDYCPLYL